MKKGEVKEKTIPRTCQCGTVFYVRWNSDPKRICGQKCANSRGDKKGRPQRRIQTKAGVKPKGGYYAGIV